MTLNINGRMKVKTLKSDFKKEFGLNIRVYVGREFADNDSTLASIRKGDAKGGEFSPARNTKVGNLEDKILDMFGLKTQISGSDDSYLCENDYTLAKALEVDEKLMVKRANRSSNDSSSSNSTTITSITEVSLEDSDLKEATDYCYEYSQEGIIKGYEAAVEVLNQKVKPYVDAEVFKTFLIDTGVSAMEWNYEDELERAIAFETPLIDVLQGNVVGIDEKVIVLAHWIDHLEEYIEDLK